jgi:4-aminobutyrate aminotransferase-like enzyme
MRGLSAIRKHVSGAKVETLGLADRFLRQFDRDPCLLSAVTAGRVKQLDLLSRFGDLLSQDEAKVIAQTQQGVMNFYDATTVNPFVPIAAQGPWLVTSHGAVVYDAGGYGMLGFGHNPPHIMSVLGAPHVMANVMTPSFSHLALDRALKEEIGHSNPKKVFPYERFTCLNSGSECNSLAMRIADHDSRLMTAKDGPHPGWQPCLISLRGSFHGRTERPAQASDSSSANYKQNLSSYEHWMPLHTVVVNDITMLRETWEKLNSEKKHVEMMLMEPVMGEGNPGVSVNREFYDEARALANKNRSLLLVDSIQAGLRCHGVLSIMDYPDFQGVEPPDFETFSKAINAGQYPLSVLMMGPRVPEIYVQGLYGNTMTNNPRSAETAVAVLESFSPELRANIREMGQHLKEGLQKLQWANTDAIVDVTGTGLLVACHLKPEFRAIGTDSVEMFCRKNGLGVIHGGKNALRFTPHFNITPKEVDLICDVTGEAIDLYRRHHGLSR